MLLLSRRVGESIVIGDGVTVRILGVGGRGVRVGIEAPRSTRILRDEVLQRDRLAAAADGVLAPPAVPASA